MNLGECLLTRFETNYSLMARVLCQTQYSRNAKKKYLKDFEEYDSDSDVRIPTEQVDERTDMSLYRNG